MFRFHLARGFALSFALVAPAWAQVPISGNVSDTTTGPLLAGTVYHATGNLTVPGGQTLTAQAGAVVKFVNPGTHWTISGTLDCQGTLASPVIFSDIRDDTAGGDTNGDGAATSPAPGWWHGTLFYAGSTGLIGHTEVRYAGWGGYGGFDLQNPSVTLSVWGSLVRDCAAAGFDFDNYSFPASVTDCAVERCGFAADNVLLSEVASFVDCTATANAGDFVRVTNGGVTADATIGPDNTFGNPLVSTVTITVLAGRTVTLLPGAIVKMQNSGTYWNVSGTLDWRGRAGSPVIVTDLRDDTAGGDTNQDGSASSPTPGWWHGVLFYSGSAATFVEVDVRYAGWGAYGGIDLQHADVTLDVSSSRIRDCAAAGVDLDNFESTVSFLACSIERCGIAADNVLLGEVESFVDCTASGNQGDYVHVTNGGLATKAVIGPANLFGHPLVTAATCTISGGAALTLLPGTVVKMQNAGTYWNLDGALDCQGTLASPVVFTSFRDDTIGGDTNGDGAATLPAPGWWHGILLYGGSALTMAHSEVRYAGWGAYGGIDLQHFAVTLDVADSLVRDCAAAGIDFDDFSPTASVARCAIEACGVAIDHVLLSEVASFVDNTAANCAGNYIRTSNSTMPADATISAENLIGGALVLAANASIPAGRRLTLNAGTVFKLATGATYVWADGALDVAGTPLAPVVFTELRDDRWAGDTNADGSASSPVQGFWDGVFVRSNTDAMTIDGLIVAYAGYGAYPGLDVSSPVATVRNVRAESCAADGIDADQHAGVARGWVAYDCEGYGIDMAGGAFDLDHATVAKCTSWGIRKNAAWTGNCTNSIAWSNTAGNYTGFAAGQLLYSDGSPALAGSNGNINLSPIFEGINVGDLDLKSTSPCVDTGDPAAPPDFDGTRTDMGAYPFNHCAPVAYCTAKVNSLGCTPAIRFNGYASMTLPAPFDVYVVNVINNRTGIYFYGQNGRASAPFQGGTLCVNPPTKRTPLQDSGGNPPAGGDDCSGEFHFDFNDWIRTGSDPSVLAGSVIDGQYWYRDPQSPSTTGLSGGIEYWVCP